MAKNRIGAERKSPRMSYLTRSPSEPPELMSLDESETLLGSQYGINSRFVSPSVTVVDLGAQITPSSISTPLLNRPTTGTSTITTASTLLSTDQNTISSQGTQFLTNFAIGTSNSVCYLAEAHIH